MAQFQFARYILMPSLIRTIDAIQISDFIAIMHHIAVYMMVIVFTRQIYPAHFPISHRAAFVYKIVYPHICSEHHLSVGVHIMCRTAQPAIHIRQIWNYLLELLQIDTSEFYRHFLIGNRIFTVGIETDTCTLFVHQTDISINTSPIG